MRAHELKKDDLFTVVGHVDPEAPCRICLENDGSGAIKWGFPGKSFWSFMGHLCEVELVNQ